MTIRDRIAVIDPAVGAAGDMFLGGLLALHGDEALLTTLPARLGLEDAVTLSIHQVERAALSATQVVVLIRGEAETASPHAHLDHANHSHAPHQHSHGPSHSHAHHHAAGHGTHRHLREILARIDAGELTDTVKEKARRAYQLLAEAEAKVHGVAVDDVSLHEVGAWDALIDIVGTCEGFERLGVTEIYNTPVALGHGWITAAHGAMPVPAPATGALIQGLELRTDGPASGEALTPTGATLLRVLSAGSPPSHWRPTAQGWGAGGRNPAGYANALRIWVGEAAREPTAVQVVVTDMDDFPTEYVEPLRKALGEAGALDVQVWATQMKKGRTGLRVEAQCVFSQLGAVTDAFFRHGTTAGVRHYPAERSILARHEMMVDVDGESIRVKVIEGPEGPRYKPEYDDVTAVARRFQLSALAVAQRALDLARAQARARPNEEQQ